MSFPGIAPEPELEEEQDARENDRQARRALASGAG